MSIKTLCKVCTKKYGWNVYYPSKSKYAKHCKQAHKKKSRRKHHNMTSELKLEILKRDKKCLLCGSQYELQIHHKIHRKNGGTNEPSNLMLLCCFCHAEQHRNEPVYNLMIKRIFRPIEIKEGSG